MQSLTPNVSTAYRAGCPSTVGSMGHRPGVSTQSELEGFVSRSRFPWFCRFLTHSCGSQDQHCGRLLGHSTQPASPMSPCFADTATCAYLGQLISSLLMAKEEGLGFGSSMCCPEDPLSFS